MKRFVFVSSIKALGEGEPGRPWREDDAPAPVDPYGITKLEAERVLAEFGRDHGMEVVTLRPPLVYGPGVRANFEQLMKAVERGIPLPLGAVDAHRSMVYVGNLADAIRFVATRPEATEGVYHVTDGEDLTVSGDDPDSCSRFRQTGAFAAGAALVAARFGKADRPFGADRSANEPAAHGQHSTSDRVRLEAAGFSG